MTRYARAKGSKASNERLPNEATPWYLMKQQLEEGKNKKFLETRKSAEELLKNERDLFYSNTTKNINHDWAEFDDNKCESVKKDKNSKSKKNCTYPAESFGNDTACTIGLESNNTEKLHETEDTKIEIIDKKNMFPNKKEQHKNVCNPHTQSSKKELNTTQSDTNSNFVALSKRQKRNQKRKEMSKNEAKKFKKDTSDESSCSKVKEKKIKEEGEYKRRKPDAGITKIIINGVETEVVKYDGFPIKKEDAERLTELKQKLVMKGVPISEVDIAIKMERRRAEKALARVKKLVCFNCRISGHVLSDCPELGKEEAGTGICFKCGSTEHTHSECKVNKDSTYRYAKCFICREQGHIVAQCPDNPRGIYPQGGCCKICGAVTHLKKDCPDLVKAKEDNTITVEVMDDSVVESLQKNVKKQSMDNKQPKNKIIKF